MSVKDLFEILDMAIEIEKNSVAFYNDLKKQKRFEKYSKSIEIIENVEKSHINALKEIKMKAMNNTFEITDLAFSKNSKEVSDMYKEFCVKDKKMDKLLRIIAKREEEIYQLYQELSQIFVYESFNDIKTAFLKLAQEEKKHMEFFMSKINLK